MWIDEGDYVKVSAAIFHRVMKKFLIMPGSVFRDYYTEDFYPDMRFYYSNNSPPYCFAYYTPECEIYPAKYYIKKGEAYAI